MKLLKQYYNLQQAEHDAFRLEGLGILTFISSETTHRMGAYATGAFQVGLWAVLENQYDDAEKCLANPSLLPNNPLSPKELEDLKVGGADQALSTMVNASLKIFAAIILVVVVAYYLYPYWGKGL